MNEQKRDPRRAQKRGIIIAFAVMVSIILIWYVVIPGVGAIIDKINGKDKDDGPKSDYMDHVVSHLFYTADYDENIYEDEEYMKKDRTVAYTNGPDTYYIPLDGGDFKEYGATLEFFGKYFDTVINGRYEEYDSYFTDYYFEHQSHRERFTPQKIYAVKITLFSRTENEDKSFTYNYTVEFKIVKNNGTFRNDIGSDSSRRVFYELIESPDGNVLINYIGEGLRTED